MGVAGKLLPQRHGRCVLKMGAADLDDVAPCLCLGLQRFLEVQKRRDEPLHHLAGSGHVHGGREGVVGALRLVHMVIGVNRMLAAARPAQKLVGTTRDHFVGVHVGLGARAGLPNDQRKLVVMPTFGHFPCCRLDGLRQLALKVSEPCVHPRCRPLDVTERMDERGRHPLAADGKVLDGSLRLRAPVALAGNLDRTEAVGFRARCHDPLLASSGRTLSKG